MVNRELCPRCTAAKTGCRRIALEARIESLQVKGDALERAARDADLRDLIGHIGHTFNNNRRNLETAMRELAEFPGGCTQKP